MYKLVLKVKKSVIDPSRRGAFLTKALPKDSMVGYCSGTAYTKCDPRCKGDQMFCINIPGKNSFVDCTLSKHGKGQFMSNSGTSNATCRVKVCDHYLVFYLNADGLKDAEMTIVT